MKVSRRNVSLLLSLLLIIFSTTTTARADDDDEPDDYEVKARVVRISLIDGEVNLKRFGDQDWERTRLNYPVVEGDTLATGKDSRLEIQVDARNFVRLTANTILRIVTLRDEGIAMSVIEGTAIVRLAKFDRDREYFEIDAPKTTLAAEKTGLYRIDVPREGRVRLTVREEGRARIYSDTSGFTLRDNRSAELVISGDTAGDWELLTAAAPDAIDNWVSDRERYLEIAIAKHEDAWFENGCLLTCVVSPPDLSLPRENMPELAHRGMDGRPVHLPWRDRGMDHVAGCAPHQVADLRPGGGAGIGGLGKRAGLHGHSFTG